MAGKNIVVGISGASGAVYAQRLLQLLDADARVEHIILVASSGGLRLLRHELNIGARELAQLPAALLGQPFPSATSALPLPAAATPPTPW
jgi:4-hydroxy-3-polyprenylbenzoate decarboxylase